MKQSALLQGGPVYDTLDFPVGGLALYDATRLSVADSAVDSVSLTQLPRDDARDCVSRWSELMFNSEAEQKLVDATIEPPRLYQDPILGCSRVVYRRFIRTLFRKRLLVRFSRTPRFHCTCFFVHEKQGRQHLIEDAGETNRHFKRATSVALASLEALAGLECSADSRFWISTVDVRDALHRMALPDDLSDCFSLPGGTAREFGVYELDGKPLGGDDHLWPCCQCLPMGFSWAAVVEAAGIAESELLHDRQVNLSLEHGPRAFVCIDNIGLIGKDREEV